MAKITRCKWAEGVSLEYIEYHDVEWGVPVYDDKVQLITSLWKVAYADGDLDKYEEHLIRRVADLLYVPHDAFIRAKLSAL